MAKAIKKTDEKKDVVGQPLPIIGKSESTINSEKRVNDLQSNLIGEINKFTKENECSIFEIYEALLRTQFAYNKRFLKQHIDQNESKGN